MDITKQIQLGDIYWLKKENDIMHPHVVIKLAGNKIMVCAITTNAKKANLPGNVLLDINEGNLEKQSIVDVAKYYEINRSDLINYAGTLNSKRVDEIVIGIQFLNNTYF